MLDQIISQLNFDGRRRCIDMCSANEKEDETERMTEDETERMTEDETEDEKQRMRQRLTEDEKQRG